MGAANQGACGDEAADAGAHDRNIEHIIIALICCRRRCRHREFGVLVPLSGIGASSGALHLFRLVWSSLKRGKNIKNMASNVHFE